MSYQKSTRSKEDDVTRLKKLAFLTLERRAGLAYSSKSFLASFRILDQLEVLVRVGLALFQAKLLVNERVYCEIKIC